MSPGVCYSAAQHVTHVATIGVYIPYSIKKGMFSVKIHSYSHWGRSIYVHMYVFDVFNTVSSVLKLIISKYRVPAKT